jgi:hypothetical protein
MKRDYRSPGQQNAQGLSLNFAYVFERAEWFPRSGKEIMKILLSKKPTSE